MLSEANSFLYLSITTYLGGFPGIGMNGSITYDKMIKWIQMQKQNVE